VLDSLISHLQRIVTHPVLGVVCDLLRAQVTTEKDSVVLTSASACVRVYLTDLTFTENRDTPGIRSSVRFTTRTSHYRQRLGSAQKCVCEDLTH